VLLVTQLHRTQGCVAQQGHIVRWGALLHVGACVRRRVVVVLLLLLCPAAALTPAEAVLPVQASQAVVGTRYELPPQKLYEMKPPQVKEYVQV